MGKKFIFTVLGLFLFNLAGFSQTDGSTNKVIAKVNNEVITAKDKADFIKAMAWQDSQDPQNQESKPQEQALERLIDDKLILNAARKLNIPIPKPMIEDKIRQVQKKFPSREAFEVSIISDGYTMTMFRKKIEEQILMRLAIERNVQQYVAVSPVEINLYYYEHKNELTTPGTYLFWAAKISDPETAKKILETIKRGGIQEAKKQFPDQLNPIESTLTQLRPELAKALEKMTDNESKIIIIEDSQYVLYLEKFKPAQTPSLDQSLNQIKEIIWRKKFQEKFKEWIDSLRDEAVIKIY